jgi:hypothetical protein
VRHQAVGEAERILADARAKVSELEGSIGALRSEHDTAVGQTRELVDRLASALDQHGAGQHRQD